jgi:HK97 gp10 family phage protein
MEGLADLEKALVELPKATARNTLQRALKKGAEHVQEVWQGGVPVLTGHYQHSINVGPASKLTRTQKRDAKKDGKYFAEMHVGTDDPAGQQLEFGNVKMPAQPSGRPAWDITKESVLADISTDLATEIEKSRARLARKAERLAAASMGSSA